MTEDQDHEDGYGGFDGDESEIDYQRGFDMFNEPEERDLKAPSEKKSPPKQEKEKTKKNKWTKGAKDNTRLQQYEAAREIFAPENIHKWDDESILSNLIDTSHVIGLTPAQAYIAQQTVRHQVDHSNQLQYICSAMNDITDELRYTAKLMPIRNPHQRIYN